MTEQGYLETINEAYRDALLEHEEAFVMGEDIRRSVTGSTKDLAEEFERERVRDLPMSENGFTGIAAGAAMLGGRPIVEYQINTLPYLSLDQIANNAQKYRMMSGGDVSVPLVMTVVGSGASGGNAAQHSDNVYPLLMNVGVKTIVPSTPYDVKGLFRSAVAENDPVMVFFPAQLMGQRGEVPDTQYSIPLGEADVKRSGEDVTVIAIGETVPTALAAAENLDISVEVIDPRTLLPLDEETIFTSVRKTQRAVIVDPANRTCGAAAEIGVRISNNCIWSLDATVKRVTRAGAPISYSPPQEEHVLPDRETIERSNRDVTW
jgi:pyruvate dehydrogenase E1 component beta subunit